MSVSQRIALVSGANRGIGLEIVRQLAAKNVTVVLTSRNPSAGEAAAQKLSANGLAVLAWQLDVTDPASVQRLADGMEAEFGRLDILVNNAGIYLDQGQHGFDANLDVVRTMLETNLFGAWQLCKAFIPLMRRGGYGRIVNVSSGMGQLQDMEGGSPAYRVSKTSLNALTCILADELRDAGILVNAACPGWVRTEMGGREAPRSVEQGADTPVWLATLPDDGPTGGFFRDRQPIPW
jgi:NAD(P)-dependent dehydrogenase (short-subunit alcohol dehydrogenase family)